MPSGDAINKENSHEAISGYMQRQISRMRIKGCRIILLVTDFKCMNFIVADCMQNTLPNIFKLKYDEKLEFASLKFTSNFRNMGKLIRLFSEPDKKYVLATKKASEYFLEGSSSL